MGWTALTTVTNPFGNPAASALVESTMLICVWSAAVAPPFNCWNPKASSLDPSHSIAGIARNLNLLTGGRVGLAGSGSLGSGYSTVPEPSDEDSMIRSAPKALDQIGR